MQQLPAVRNMRVAQGNEGIIVRRPVAERLQRLISRAALSIYIQSIQSRTELPF